jgi:hypothetical protein
MDRRLFLLACLACAVSAPVARADAPAEQWVVVTAPAFRDVLKPLVEHRKAQGMRVRVVETIDHLRENEILGGDAGKLKAHVHKLCRDFTGTRYVLLVGAVDAGKGPDRLKDPGMKVVPTFPGTVGRMKGEPSDNAYGCLGESLEPTVAVGRFPARSVAEAKAMVEKTLAYERDKKPGEWKRRVTVLAGAPSFNAAVDSLVERVALSKLDKLDVAWSGRAIYHNPASRFCVPDEVLRERALRYVEGGEAITLYLGHSSARGFAPGRFPYLERRDWANLNIKRGNGIFATFGCLGAQLRGPDGEGYALAAMRNPRGPVAALGSHGICFAAMVQLAADGFVERFFAAAPPRRLGPCSLGLKTALAKTPVNPLMFALLDAVDGDGSIPLETQRQEHLEMFVLLGDPALVLATIPATLKLKTPEEVEAGATIEVKGTAPAALEGATVRVSLERPLASEPTGLQPLVERELAEGDRARTMLANHERANAFVLVVAEAKVKDGCFAVRLKMPATLPWKQLTLRAYAAAEKNEAMGVAKLKAK